MAEYKYDVRRGADSYRVIYHARLKNWILKGIIKKEESTVWRSGLSGWRKPEDLPELRPYFEQREAKERQKKFNLKGTESFRGLKKKIKKILIIDDEEDLCWLLSNALGYRGLDISTAHTIRQAKAALSRDVPDLIFLDLKLPDGDGISLLPEIKTLATRASVVVISAYGSDDRKEEATSKAQVCGFIDKPFTIEKILNAMGISP